MRTGRKAMQVHISIGENHRFELREALLVYGDRQRTFVTRHQVTLRKDVRILVVGAGGTGSAIMMGLKALAITAEAGLQLFKSAGAQFSDQAQTKCGELLLRDLADSWNAANRQWCKEVFHFGRLNNK